VFLDKIEHIMSTSKKTHYFFESGAKKASGSRLAHFESQEFTVANDCLSKWA
jgi:hypothetical protein